MDTSNVKIEVFEPIDESIEDLNAKAAREQAARSAKEQAEILKEKYKEFKNGRNWPKSGGNTRANWVVLIFYSRVFSRRCANLESFVQSDEKQVFHGLAGNIGFQGNRQSFVTITKKDDLCMTFFNSQMTSVSVPSYHKGHPDSTSRKRLSVIA